MFRKFTVILLINSYLLICKHIKRILYRMSNNQLGAHKMHKVDTATINISTWPTPPHKIKKAFNDGKLHAVNHYFDEEPNQDWPFGVKSWAVNPYTIDRPDAFYSWLSGFCSQWGELKRGERGGK